MLGFFGLSRELRDVCYEYMLIPHIGILTPVEHARYRFAVEEKSVEPNPIADYAALQAFNASDERLMSVSHRFRTEYLEAAGRCLWMRFDDVDGPYYGVSEIPHNLLKPRALHVRADLYCTHRKDDDEADLQRVWCDMDYLLSALSRKLNELIQDVNLPDLTIEICIERDIEQGHLCVEKVVQNQTMLTTLNCFKELILRNDEMLWDGRRALCDGRVIMRYCHTAGKLMHVYQAEKAAGGEEIGG